MLLAAAKRFARAVRRIAPREPRIPHVKLASFEGIVPKTTDWRRSCALEEAVS